MSEIEKRPVTPLFRGAFVSVLEPMKQRKKKGASDDKLKDDTWGICAIYDVKNFSPADKARYEEMLAAAEAESIRVFKKPLSKLPKGYHTPFRDAADKADQYDGFEEGMVFINHTTRIKPRVMGSDGKTPITDPNEIYDGAFYRVSWTVYSYNNESKGVAIGMCNIKKVKNGPKLITVSDTTKDFEDIGEEDLGDADESLE